MSRRYLWFVNKAPPWKDPVTEEYKRGIDRTLILEQLRRSPEERLRRIEDLQRSLLELQRARRVR